MNDIEKAIEKLKSDIRVLDNYLKSRPDCMHESYFENELIKDMQFAISALEKQLNNNWIPVSDGDYVITVKGGEITKCQSLKI